MKGKSEFMKFDDRTLKLLLIVRKNQRSRCALDGVKVPNYCDKYDRATCFDPFVGFHTKGWCE